MLFYSRGENMIKDKMKKKKRIASIVSLSISILAIYYLWKGTEYLLVKLAPFIGGI
jgi:hypothetical protein